MRSRARLLACPCHARVEEQRPGADARDCEGVFSGGVGRAARAGVAASAVAAKAVATMNCECAHGPDDVAKPLHRRSIAAPSRCWKPVATVRSWFVPCRRSPFGFSARSRRWSTVAVWTCRVAASVHCSASCFSKSARSCRSTRWSTRSGVSRRPRAPGTWCTSTCRGSGACLAMRRSSSPARPGTQSSATPAIWTPRASPSSFEQRAPRSPAELDEALKAFDEALGLWRGDALADVALEGEARSAAARLDDERRAARAERVDVALALGRHNELIPDLEREIAAEPLDEQVLGQLMLGPLPQRSTGRRACALPRRPADPRRGARDRARRGAASAGAGDSPPRPGVGATSHERDVCGERRRSRGFATAGAAEAYWAGGRRGPSSSSPGWQRLRLSPREKPRTRPRPFGATSRSRRLSSARARQAPHGARRRQRARHGARQSRRGGRASGGDRRRRVAATSARNARPRPRLHRAVGRSRQHRLQRGRGERPRPLLELGQSSTSAPTSPRHASRIAWRTGTWTMSGCGSRLPSTSSADTSHVDGEATRPQILTIAGVLPVRSWTEALVTARFARPGHRSTSRFSGCESARRNATVQVRQARRSVDVAEESRKVAERARDLARETERLSRVAFQEAPARASTSSSRAGACAKPRVSSRFRSSGWCNPRMAALLALSRCRW